VPSSGPWAAMKRWASASENGASHPWYRATSGSERYAANASASSASNGPQLEPIGAHTAGTRPSTEPRQPIWAGSVPDSETIPARRRIPPRWGVAWIQVLRDAAAYSRPMNVVLDTEKCQGTTAATPWPLSCSMSTTTARPSSSATAASRPTWRTRLGWPSPTAPSTPSPSTETPA
jgi:hypothetical protein